MKVIEPLSSALLVTGCVYAAGIAQNASFMRFFGVNPAFSQPAIDRIFYDGGLITFQLFVQHLFLLSLSIISLAIIIFLMATLVSLIQKVPLKGLLSKIIAFFQGATPSLGKLSGLAALLYLIFLTFSSYDKAKEDGKKIAETFVKTCHVVVIKKSSDQTEGCAFNKDRDSIWFYTITDGNAKANSKLLSELDQITYKDPIEF